MKLTTELKTEIDGYTSTKLKTLFRFFPSDITTGESGRYIQNKVKDRPKDTQGSSSGRTSDFDSDNGGSSPSP